MKQYVAILLGILFVLTASTVSAEMYMYMDNGVVVFTDSPRPNSIGISSSSSIPAPKKHFTKSYQHYIEKAAQKYGLDARLLKAVIEVESNYNEFAISKKGAMGLMQLMPRTASELGVFNAFDPEDNIDGGAKYLKKLINKFDGNLSLALAAYNAGPKAVEKHGTIPPYKETRNYVKKVFSLYKGKRNLSTKQAPKQSIYKVVLDDGTILFTNDEFQARKASRL